MTFVDNWDRFVEKPSTADLYSPTFVSREVYCLLTVSYFPVTSVYNFFRPLTVCSAEYRRLYMVLSPFRSSVSSLSEIKALILPCSTLKLVSNPWNLFSVPDGAYSVISFINLKAFPSFRKMHNKRHPCGCPLAWIFQQ